MQFLNVMISKIDFGNESLNWAYVGHKDTPITHFLSVCLFIAVLPLCVERLFFLEAQLPGARETVVMVGRKRGGVEEEER